MKSFTTLFSLLVFSSLFMQSCVKDNCDREVTYTKAIPVIIQPEEFRIEIKSELPRSLKSPGKLYLKDQYIYINEFKEGIHIIDNSIPESPQNIAFIPIPGNVDIAIKDHILYADNYIDLLAIDIMDPMNVSLSSRVEDVFQLYRNDQNDVILDYEYQEVTETVNCDSENFDLSFGDIRFAGSTRNEFFVDFSSGAANEAGQIVNGTAGSLSRFSLISDYLYMLDQTDMYLYDVSQCDQPSFHQTINITWPGNLIETIFPYGENLFIGSNNGIFIYDNTDPANPSFRSSLIHTTSCDPVFVKDDYAYVTLRTGNNCEGFINELDVIDISNINSPSLSAVFNMSNPHGLSVYKDKLYLCEGEIGLKVFDAADPLTVGDNRISTVSTIHAYDVIAMPTADDILLVIGKDGFYQYDAADPTDLKEISSIPVE